MKAVVVLADGFEEVEAVTPIDLLRRAGVTVEVAGLNGMTAQGARGVTFGCDTVLDPDGDWDALILPGGGPGAQRLSESEAVLKAVGRSLERGVWLAAICAAPAAVLGKHGFLEGKQFTGYPGTEAEGFGGSYIVEPVVVDGTLITSRGVATASAFALTLVEKLAGSAKAAEVARAVLLA
jgi:4-methyl-5(b-hydroxyethyl)-thiazole monophosphate biosynthesis